MEKTIEVLKKVISWLMGILLFFAFAFATFFLTAEGADYPYYPLYPLVIDKTNTKIVASGTTSTFQMLGSMQFDSGQLVDEIITTLSGASTNSQLPTASATVAYVAAENKVKVATTNYLAYYDTANTISGEARLSLTRAPDGTANYVLRAAGAGSNPAYSLLDNNSIDPSAGIAWSKLATGTANYVMISDGSGYPTTEQYLSTARGGTGIGSYAQGDIPYYNTGTALSVLNKTATANSFLKNSGTSNNPAWSTIATTDLSDSAAIRRKESIALTASSVTPTTTYREHVYTFASDTSVTFSTTGFGTLSNLTDGDIIRIVGTSDTYTLTIGTSDITNGRLMNGPITLAKGNAITFEYNSTLARMVEISRNK